MEENLNLFDFELDAEDMQAIAKLDTAHSLFLDHHSGETTKQFMEWRAVVMAVTTFILLVTHDTQGEIIFCCITPHNKTHIQAIRPGLGASVLFLRSVTVDSGRMVPKSDSVLSIQFFSR